MMTLMGTSNRDYATKHESASYRPNKPSVGLSMFTELKQGDETL